MFRLFTGPARILGIRDGRRNCKGFAGNAGTVERGTPGWIPSQAAGRDVEISSFESELTEALQPYKLKISDLPDALRKALLTRKAFTLVEAEQPTDVYKGRIDAEALVAKLLRHEQSTLSLEQVSVYAIHNGRLLNDGKRLALPEITPYPGLEKPVVYEIPDELPSDDGQLASSTEGGTKERGRLTLHTSKDHMPNAYKSLKPRWQICYRTRFQMIGTKPISELVPNTPGAAFIYGTVELPALEPAYVEHGRKRPKSGPLVEALDRFIGEKIRDLAGEINARRKQELDDKALDEVQKENQILDGFKNKFLPDFEEGSGGGAGPGGGGHGGDGGGSPEWGSVPETIELDVPDGGIQLAKGVSVDLKSLLRASVRDTKGQPVRVPIQWGTSDSKVAAVTSDGTLIGAGKGQCTIKARVKSTNIVSDPINVRIWLVDHVLLTPRELDIPLGKREEITAEVTDDNGNRSTEVILDWKHDADDPLVVRISRRGTVTGNRIGRCDVTAGAGEVWARIPVDVKGHGEP